MNIINKKILLGAYFGLVFFVNAGFAMEHTDEHSRLLPSQQKESENSSLEILENQNTNPTNDDIDSWGNDYLDLRMNYGQYKTFNNDVDFETYCLLPDTQASILNNYVLLQEIKKRDPQISDSLVQNAKSLGYTPPKKDNCIIS